MPAMAPDFVEEILCTVVDDAWAALDAVELAATSLGDAEIELVVFVVMVVERQ